MNMKDLHNQSMADPAYKDAYDVFEGEYSLASALISARSRAGMTQAQVAERMRTKQSAISRIESGRNVSIEKIREYAEAVGASVSIQIA